MQLPSNSATQVPCQGSHKSHLKQQQQQKESKQDIKLSQHYPTSTKLRKQTNPKLLADTRQNFVLSNLSKDPDTR